MNVQEALAARISANKFDTTDELAADEVQALVAAAMEAPSAFNIQHARFLVVREPDAREAGLLDAAGAAGFAASGQGSYAGKPEFARDEAIRSASMAAMALMLAATERGLASGPMIGFDPQALRREFNIDARYLPVMLIAVGRPAPGNWPRKPRLRVHEVLVDDARPGQVHAFS